jgi:UDP-N-acetylmuramate dehydrogenase
LTTLGVGGDAEWLVTATDPKDVVQTLGLCREHGVPWRVLGGGSNLLIDDGGVAGVVLAPRGICFEYVTVAGERVVAGAAVRLHRLLTQAAEWGLSGLEPLAGVPGTLGGAVVGNAGGRHGDIGSAVSAVVGYSAEGELLRRQGDESHFRYRESNLRDLVVTAVELSLRGGVKEEIAARMAEIIEERRRSQPLDARSAGCFFRNPPGGRSAGELIDRAGLKGVRSGGAEVSPVHANYIVNRGGATSRDILSLVALVRGTVREQFGVQLELEVQLWSKNGLPGCPP